MDSGRAGSPSYRLLSGLFVAGGFFLVGGGFVFQCGELLLLFFAEDGGDFVLRVLHFGLVLGAVGVLTFGAGRLNVFLNGVELGFLIVGDVQILRMLKDER